MSNYNSEIDISSSLILTEELKAELLSSVSKLYTSMTHGDITTSARSEIFADILSDTYLQKCLVFQTMHLTQSF